MSTSVGVGNLTIEPVELNSSALNVHNRPNIDNSLVTGNDIYISPNGGLTENGPYEFVLSGDSSFHKIWNFSRLFGEFHLVDSVTGKLITDAVDVSFVNNIGHSWISSIEVFLMTKMLWIKARKVMPINLLLKTVCPIPIKKKGN